MNVAGFFSCFKLTITYWIDGFVCRQYRDGVAHGECLQVCLSVFHKDAVSHVDTSIVRSFLIPQLVTTKSSWAPEAIKVASIPS